MLGFVAGASDGQLARLAAVDVHDARALAWTQSTQTTGAPREALEGALNYTRVDAVVACGGATSPAALAELKQRGFRSVLNLRQASEPNANVEEEGRMVRDLGMTYLHIPFDGSKPTPQPIESFLAALDEPDHLPMYIHCGTANRVGAMWFVKRVLRDRWPFEKALTEAEAIGLTNPVLRTYMMEFVKK
jgi:uncharacterized protein (TIGR01244 family)